MWALEIWSKFWNIWVCKKLDKLPITDNFLVFFIVFGWVRIFESVVVNRKRNVICNHILIVFLWRFTYFRLYNFKKTYKVSQNCWLFFNSSAKYSNEYVNVHRKIIRTWLCIIFQFVFINWTFKNSTPFKTIKNTEKLSVFDKNDSCRLFNYSQTHIFRKFDHISRTHI